MSPKSMYSLLLPAEMPWTEAKHICNALGKGKITDINKNYELQQMVMLVKETRSSCVALWTPITDKAEEGVFLNSNTGAVEPFLPFINGNPNGGRSQNFVSLFVAKFGYGDEMDQRQYCVSCNLELSTSFRLRGLCQSSYMGKYVKLHLTIQLFPRYNLCSYPRKCAVRV
jgi:hypothetical protein